MLNFDAPREIQLRPYQADAIEQLRAGIRAGSRRQILCAGTGAGKTVMAASLLREADRKGRYALFLVDRVALVHQTSATMDSYGIRHGIVQGRNERWSPRENVQVCSVQTLAKRALPRDPDLLIYDEAHCQYRDTLAYMAQHPRAVKIGLTATPFAKGMAEHWDGMVNVIPTRQLVEGGYLIEPKIYIATSPDDTDLGLNKHGEFSASSTTSAGIKIIGDVVKEWIAKTAEHFGGPVKTIVFSPTVEHGRELCAAFGAAGFNFQQVSYLDRNDAERAEKIAEFRRPDSIIHGLVSCGVLTKGFDVPDVKCGIACRPYRKSLSGHMQEIGRVMRTHPDKSTALWLDHAGNVERFGVEMFDVWTNGPGALREATKRDVKPRVRDSRTREAMVCPECGGAIWRNTCASCGWERPARSDVVQVPGHLRAWDADAARFAARDGLRADCLSDPRRIWDAALVYTTWAGRGDDTSRRKWAYGIFCGIYPHDRLPRGWYGAPVPSGFDDPAAYALIEREVRRYRKTRKRRVTHEAA